MTMMLNDDDAENIGDDPDPAEEHARYSDDNSGKTGKPRSLPTWLMHEFDNKVKESANRGVDGLPPLYKHNRTFWFPQHSSFFILQEDVISPQKLYNPRFFLWDPATLCHGGIPCPVCKTRLYRHDHIPHPRRCIDLHDTFWIIGYRYRCPECVHPVSQKHNVTFRSWDSRILAALPRSLALEFPARLSHRSAISWPAFVFMRSCFQNGMGAKQFSDALRVQHLQSYDELRLQYLRSLISRKGLASWRSNKFKAFLPFQDTSLDGYNGFTPSSQWLRDMYD